MHPRVLLPVLFLLLILSACEQQTQYKILTTVFTGVPPMEELYADEAPEEKAQGSFLTEKEAKTRFKHPLWASKQCSACHLDASEAGAKIEQLQPENKSEQVQLEPEHTSEEASDVEKVEQPMTALEAFVGDGEGDTGQLQARQESVPVGGLILPVEKLCIRCHHDKTARRAIRDRLWLHNPVALGDCLACHADHESANIAHLRLPLPEVCTSCHDTEQLPLECVEGHEDDQAKSSCLNCHNTHMGRDRFLLSRDFTEIKIPAGTILPTGIPQSSSAFPSK